MSSLTRSLAVGVMLAALDVSGQAARLVDFGFLAGQPGFSLFSIDPSVGTQSPIVSTVTTSGMYGGGQALDPVRQRFFFLKQDTSELVTVDLQTQQITHVAVPACCGFLQYDIVSGRLLDFGFLPGQPGFSVFSISPTTGAYTPIVNTVTTSGMYGGGQALDPVGQRFFFLKQDTSELVTVDLQTQQTTHVAVPACCGFLQYDIVSGRLLDFGFLPGQPGFSVFSISPTTGAYTPIVNTVTTSGMYGGGQALDSVGQRFFFIKQDTSELVTVDLQTHQVSSVVQPTCCGFLSFDFGTLPIAVPVGSPENMILLAVLLLAIGIFALRK